MATDLSLIDTIVVLMMENRSFDHMLGYLSLARYGGRADVNGLRDDPAWLAKVANPLKNVMIQPAAMARAQIADPPHERRNIELQLGGPSAGVFPLNGFADSAAEPDVMYYQTPGQVPIYDFLARNYRICDRWFSCLPAGTQPNRLMAMSGYTLIDRNQRVLPDQRLVYQWLSDLKVRWRVYHQGIFPFFTMMLRWVPEIATSDNFRRFERFAVDWKLESDATAPQVIFIEPSYNDSPDNQGHGTDDHSISSVYGGQQLVHDVYTTMLNSKRWRNSALIITYDEHGGFWDHEQPIALETRVFDDRWPVFQTSGIRVPGIIVSPFVSGGTVFSQNLDHTSILKLLGRKFGGGGYSREVDSRGVENLADAFDLAAARTDKPGAPDPAPNPALPGLASILPASNSSIAAFEHAFEMLRTGYPHELASKFPDKLDLLGL